MRHLLALIVLALISASPAFAVLPDEQLSDPKLEARARHISQELRCVVCQNQTIDDSDASLAHDLRVLLRERLLKGDTDEQAKAYLVKRYGTYVLLKPPFRWDTLFLWLGPLLVILIGGSGAAFYLMNRNTALAHETPLSAAENDALGALLKDEPN
jgi:cytochrome c-type biogenesis protein CcmH